MRRVRKASSCMTGIDWMCRMWGFQRSLLTSNKLTYRTLTDLWRTIHRKYSPSLPLKYRTFSVPFLINSPPYSSSIRYCWSTAYGLTALLSYWRIGWISTSEPLISSNQPSCWNNLLALNPSSSFRTPTRWLPPPISSPRYSILITFRLANLYAI